MVTDDTGAVTEDGTEGPEADPVAASAGLLEKLAGLAAGDPERAELRRQVVELHLPLVQHLARRFLGRGEPYDDLVQVGTIGLLNAVDRFDPARGSFTGFAVPTILGEIRRHFRDRGWAVRVPRRLQELSRRVGIARAELTQRLGRSPTVPELAAHLEVGSEAVLEALESAGMYATLPMPSGPDGAELDVPVVEEDFEVVENRELLRPLLNALAPRERRIIVLRFVRNMSQSQIAEEVGISQMHVSRLLSRTLASMRQSLDEPGEP